MRRWLAWISWITAGSVLLLPVGCNASLTGFDVPASAWAGHEFVVGVSGAGAYVNPLYPRAGCVLQLPLGFTIVSDPGGTRDDPALLAMYTPEPGHYLASFYGQPPGPLTTQHFVVSAPAQVGAHALKVAIVGGDTNGAYVVADPPGVTDFAAITTAPFAATVTLTAEPTTGFQLEPTGIGSVPVPWLAAGDFDRDGRDDLATGTGVWLSRAGQPWERDSAWGMIAPATGDFDGDGYLDVADASGRVWFGSSAGMTAPITGYNSAVDAPMLAADIDGDGRDEILRAVFNNQSWAIWAINLIECDANRTFSFPSSLTYFATASRITRLSLADIDGNGEPDLVTDVGVVLQTGGVFSPSTWAPWTFHRLVAADLTGDGRAEVVVVGATVQAFEFVGGQLVPSTVTGLPPGPLTDAVAADFDLDGDLDLVFAGLGLSLWRNSGAGDFTFVADSGLPPALAAFPNPNIGALNGVDGLCVGDFDGDAFPDLAATVQDVLLTPIVFDNLATGAASFGTDCSAPTAAAPRLAAVGQPVLGNATFALALAQGAPGGVALVWGGTSYRLFHGQPELPISLGALGAPGCAVLVDAATWQVVALDAVGNAALPMPVPNVPALRRVSLFAQMAAFHPGANGLGLLTSRGLVVRMQ